MYDHQPLTPGLYQKLQSIFGEVRVANEGDECVHHDEPDHGEHFSLSGVARPAGRRRQTIDSPGEYYRVNCPLCGDERFRLWVSHRLQDFPWLMHCYRCEGYRDRANRQSFYDMLFRPGQARLQVRRGHRYNPGDLDAYRHPGDLVPLRRLPVNHPARSYLLGRLFDPDYLSDRYAVCVCTHPADPKWSLMRGRITLPVMFRHKTVGWQGRYPADLPDWKNTPKYFGMPGQWKKYVLYNFDAALRMPWAVIVEGVTDVWRIGPFAMAPLGSSIGPYQYQLLATAYAGRPLGIMFDGDDPRAAEKAQAVYDRLAESRNGPTFMVRCPAGADPGKLSTAVNYEIIAEAAARELGLALDFNQPEGP